MTDFDKYDEPRLHMERLLKAPLIELDVPIRTLILLESANVRTLGDLAQCTKESLVEINQLGKLSIERLENLLQYHRLSFRK